VSVHIAQHAVLLSAPRRTRRVLGLVLPGLTSAPIQTYPPPLPFLGLSMSGVCCLMTLCAACLLHSTIDIFSRFGSTTPPSPPQVSALWSWGELWSILLLGFFCAAAAYVVALTSHALQRLRKVIFDENCWFQLPLLAAICAIPAWSATLPVFNSNAPTGTHTQNLL